MSTPNWKQERDRREAAEKARRESEARAKQSKLDEELHGRAAELNRERAERDAADEASIRAHQAELKAAGVTDKESAVARADAERRASEPSCFKCGHSLKNAGPFTRVGPTSVPYEQRAAIHRHCLVCARCRTGTLGVELVGKDELVCFQCLNPGATLLGDGDVINTKGKTFEVVKQEVQPAPAAAPSGGGASFCSQCGKPRASSKAMFCGGCGHKY
jgi:hypothetical protein